MLILRAGKTAPDELELRRSIVGLYVREILLYMPWELVLASGFLRLPIYIFNCTMYSSLRITQTLNSHPAEFHSIPAAVITSLSDLMVIPKTCSSPPSFAHAAIKLGS
jgi:hypothetical protein